MHRFHRKPFLVLILALTILVLIPSLSEAQAQISLSRPLIERWHHKTEGTLNITPAISKESIYIPLITGTLISLRVNDGKLNWRTEIGGEISAGPTADDTGVYIASETQVTSSHRPQATGALRAIGGRSGITLWMRTLQAPIQGALVSNEELLFGGASDGRLYAVRKQTGEIIWVHQYHYPFLSHPVLSKDHIYIGDEGGNLLVVDQSTGQLVWRYQTRGAIHAPVVPYSQTIYVGSSDGYLYAFDERTHGLRWRVRMLGGVENIVPTPMGLLVTSLDNFVYNFSYQKGVKVWKRQLAGRTTSRPLAVGNSVLLAPLAGDECIILDVRDGKKLNAIIVGEDENTTASPMLVGNLLLITTRSGLRAFTDSLLEGF